MTLDEAVDKFNKLGADATLTLHYGVEGWSGKASWWAPHVSELDFYIEVPFTDDWWNVTAEALLEELYRRAQVEMHKQAQNDGAQHDPR